MSLNVPTLKLISMSFLAWIMMKVSFELSIYHRELDQINVTLWLCQRHQHFIYHSFAFEFSSFYTLYVNKNLSNTLNPRSLSLHPFVSFLQCHFSSLYNVIHTITSFKLIHFPLHIPPSLLLISSSSLTILLSWPSLYPQQRFFCYDGYPLW